MDSQVRRTRDKWTPSAHSVLCSNHFTPDCFESSPSAYGITKRVSLKAAAIPTIFKQVLTHEEAIPGKKKRINIWSVFIHTINVLTMSSKFKSSLTVLLLSLAEFKR